MLPSEFSAYIKQKEQIQQSRILPMSFPEVNPIVPSAIIRPPTTYRHQFNGYLPSHPAGTTTNPLATPVQQPINPGSLIFPDLPMRPNTLPLGNRMASMMHMEQAMSSSSS